MLGLGWDGSGKGATGRLSRSCVGVSWLDRPEGRYVPCPVVRRRRWCSTTRSVAKFQTIESISVHQCPSHLAIRYVAPGVRLAIQDSFLHSQGYLGRSAR